MILYINYLIRFRHSIHENTLIKEINIFVNIHDEILILRYN